MSFDAVLNKMGKEMGKVAVLRKGASDFSAWKLLKNLAPQVGFGSEYCIDSIGSYWFYGNMSNTFVQKCLFAQEICHMQQVSRGSSTAS
jgi:hypothetical protein